MTFLANFVANVFVVIMATTIINKILKIIKDLRQEPKLKPVPVRVPNSKYPLRKNRQINRR